MFNEELVSLSLGPTTTALIITPITSSKLGLTYTGEVRI
jgi:hypothetical protein